VIVVDDASNDGCVAIAARHADKIIRLTGRQSGRGYARNRGFDLARGEMIAFIDGDVAVQPDTLPRMLAALARRPELGAISACHDDRLGASNFISDYWNLLLSFGEQRHSGRCSKFASGCGMVRRAAFISAGMYDEWRCEIGCLEGVELGERMLGAGYGVVLSPDLKVTHLQRWDVPSVCKDVWRRSKVLARSLGYQRMSATAPSEVVFTLSRALAPAVALLGTVMLAAAFVPSSHTITKTVAALGALLLTNLPVHRFYAKARGLRFAVVSAPLHTFVQAIAAIALCTGWILRDVFGDVSPDATIQAYSEVGLDIWPPVPRRP
jgi:hypothetical protein